MQSQARNIAILAAAGSHKTEHVVRSALKATGRVLVTTYTTENQNNIIRRIEEKAGIIPKNVTVMGWFTFLITQCVKPYQRALTGEPFLVQGLNFKGERNRYIPKDDPRFFLDRNSDLYRNTVADLAVLLNKLTNNAVVDRLEGLFSHVLVDEVQDLAGYDLDLVDVLLKSKISMTLVGDPRQCTYVTNRGIRNKRYQKWGLSKWLDERVALCDVEVRAKSFRCNQAICDFADRIYPFMPATKSVGITKTGHDGIFLVRRADVPAYVQAYKPTVLRHSKASDTLGLAAMNIGASKGSTHDRILIFPTNPLLGYLADRDPSKLKAPEKLYVAVTRARYSVGFVVPNDVEHGALGGVWRP